MVLGLDLNSDSAWETGLEKIRIRAWTQHHALHVHHAPTYTEERLAVVPVARRVWPVPTRMQGNRMNTQRLLGHCRALNIDKAGAAAAGASPRTKPRSSTTTATPTTPGSTSTTMGLRDPFVVRREESEARATAARPPKVVTGKPRVPVGELAAYFDTVSGDDTPPNTSDPAFPATGPPGASRMLRTGRTGANSINIPHERVCLLDPRVPLSLRGRRG